MGLPAGAAGTSPIPTVSWNAEGHDCWSMSPGVKKRSCSLGRLPWRQFVTAYAWPSEQVHVFIIESYWPYQYAVTLTANTRVTITTIAGQLVYWHGSQPGLLWGQHTASIVSPFTPTMSTRRDSYHHTFRVSRDDGLGLATVGIE